MRHHSPTSQPVEQVIHTEILRMLHAQEKHRPTLSPADNLQDDLGLTSSEVVQLIATLTVKLQADPFEQAMPMTAMRTVGDLCQAYQHILTAHSHDSDASAALLASQRRAQVRRDSRRGAP
jgi:acyl carrier protein